MPDAPWKAEERYVRKKLGIPEPRTPHGDDAHTGPGKMLIEHEGFSYEIFIWELPQKVREKWEQAQRNAKGNRIPVLVISWHRRGHKTQRWVMMSFEDHLDLHVWVPLDVPDSWIRTAAGEGPINEPREG